MGKALQPEGIAGRKVLTWEELVLLKEPKEA